MNFVCIIWGQSMPGQLSMELLISIATVSPSKQCTHVFHCMTSQAIFACLTVWDTSHPSVSAASNGDSGAHTSASPTGSLMECSSSEELDILSIDAGDSEELSTVSPEHEELILVRL